MIFGIGVDISATDRFQRFIEKNNTPLLNRLFTENEITICNSRKDAASCYAARFAAKEAFLKALGTGLRGGISWHDIEVTNNHIGKPEFSISGEASQILMDKKIVNNYLSISHDAGNAIAMVVLETL